MGDWARYRRATDAPLEAMRAHFERHTYHRHAHDTYSFGLTETGAQAFTCRGAAHTSVGGMVMAFNPEDPHDGHAGDRLGFTYRMVHIGPDLVAALLSDVAERPVGQPLFADPVLRTPALYARLMACSGALLAGADPLRRDELLAGAVWALVREGARRAAGGGSPARVTAADAARVAARARAVLDEAGVAPVDSGRLAEAAGRSRFTVYRSFHARYGMSPSDYQRQLRLRTARRLLSEGVAAAQVAARTGFSDQSHLTRWFTRYFGITPGVYQRGRAG